MEMPVSGQPLPEDSVEKEITLKELVHILQRRRSALLATVLLCLVGATFYAIFSTRLYQAQGTVQVQKDGSSGIGIESALGGADGAADALSANINLQTQANILQSTTLALRVIRELHLEDTEDFKAGWSLPSFKKGTPLGPIATDVRHRDIVLAKFSANLGVAAVAGTRLIQIKYLGSNPKIDADVINRLVQGLVDYNFQTRFAATNEASIWLTGQLGDLRQQSEDLQAKVVALERQTGLFDLGADKTGKNQVYSSVLDEVQQSTAALAQAESNRILKRAIYDVVKTGDPQLISGLSGNSLGSASMGVTNSLGLIQALREQQSTLKGQIGQLSVKFGPAYPRIVELNGQEKELESELQQEVKRIGERARNDYEVAVRTEAATREINDQHRRQADQLNDRNIEYTILRQEADQSRGLYEDLLKRLKEAGILEGLRASNITVVDPGLVPSKPSRPRIALVYVGALGFGLFAGLCLALILDLVDNKIRTTDDIEHELALPLVGILPLFPIKDPTIGDNGALVQILAAPKGAYSEAIRNISAALKLTKLSLSTRVLLVSSAFPGEGKSTFARNFAIATALTGKRVLLLEADLRRPVLSRMLGDPSRFGLSSALAQGSDTIEMKHFDGVPTLDVLPAGLVPPNPAELLASQQMRDLIAAWRHQYDLIVIDAPPILPVADTRLLADLADQIVLLARIGLTARPSLRRAHRLIEVQARNASIGVILNGVKVGSSAYATYYGSAGRGYESYYGYNARSEDK